MFLTLAKIYTDAGPDDRAEQIQLLPAAQLSRWLEEFWFSEVSVDDPDARDGSFAQQIQRIRNALGHPQPIDDVDHGIAPSGLVAGVVPNPEESDKTKRAAPFTLSPSHDDLLPRFKVWHHLIYAYLIEAAGTYDVLAEVARRLVAGESLGVLRRDTLVWARNTEELFFRNPPLFGVSGVTSDLRPSRSVNRRNAYWRMFGMDLPHVIPSGWPGSGRPDDWKAHTAPGVNTDFQEKLIELLRQVWIGLVNAGNTSGPNRTDPAYLALLCEALRDMLRGRRQNGMLAREEFVYVSTMSWFHLTVLNNTPVVEDLQAQGTSPEQRLQNLAQKVGMKSAARSRELFQLAEVTSMLMRLIELGVFDEPQEAELLYDPNTQLGRDMRQIVNLWQSATGQRIKDHDAVPAASAPTQPLRIPTPAASGTLVSASANGSAAGGAS